MERQAWNPTDALRMQPTLIVQPTSTFAQIDAALGALGWALEADTAVAPPILPGEPEFASWSGRDGGSISYTFNPVVRLRPLVFYGSSASERCKEAEGTLPTVGVTELRQLLRTREPRDLLLGVLAARELQATPVLDLLTPLLEHPVNAVARAARKTREELLKVTVVADLDALREQKARHPDRSALFAHLGDAQMRRQILRWLIHDHPEANEHIVATLRSGLADSDWEVRATAMLGAVRLHAPQLREDIRRFDVPRTSSNAPEGTDRTILLAARNIALQRLAPGAVQAVSDGTAQTPSIREHLRTCMLQLPVARHDRIFLLVNALTEPLQLDAPKPPQLAGIAPDDAGYRLQHCGLDLRWIPATPHWLGTDDADEGLENPVRRVVPDRGFFIAREPVSADLARHLGVVAEGTEDAIVSVDDALELCSRLAETEGLDIALPTADQWEMAARGTDGRLYPWGNGLEDEPLQSACSPWGTRRQAGGEAEWMTVASQAVISGGRRDLRCAARFAVDRADARRAVRPVILVR
jgi:hypothetical protein